VPPLPLAAVFADLPDPRRVTENKLHALTDILTIATCAVIGGAESWEGIAVFGRAKEAFFRRSLALANGIPSPWRALLWSRATSPRNDAGRSVPPGGTVASHCCNHVALRRRTARQARASR